MPNLTPNRNRLLANRRMLAVNPETRAKRFIVKTQKFITPKQEHGEPAMQHIVHRDAQTDWPCFYWPKGCFRPIKVPDEIADFTRIVQERIWISFSCHIYLISQRCLPL